jgi:transposase
MCKDTNQQVKTARCILLPCCVPSTESQAAVQKFAHAFRDFKSDNIQIRPVYHRNEAQTRGHVLLSMFSYAIVK